MLVYLQAPGGAPLGLSLPLHWAIDAQWRRGELSRVHPDGSPWEEYGQDPDSLAAVLEAESDVPGAAGDGDPEGDAVTRPRANAAVKAWREYAVAIGACTADEAEALTRAQLVELVTPPEEQPAPEG